MLISDVIYGPRPTLAHCDVILGIACGNVILRYPAPGYPSITVNFYDTDDRRMSIVF